VSQRHRGKGIFSSPPLEWPLMSHFSASTPGPRHPTDSIHALIAPTAASTSAKPQTSEILSATETTEICEVPYASHHHSKVLLRSEKESTNLCQTLRLMRELLNCCQLPDPHHATAIAPEGCHGWRHFSAVLSELRMRLFFLGEGTLSYAARIWSSVEEFGSLPRKTFARLCLVRYTST
jgi:hypothetical protein